MRDDQVRRYSRHLRLQDVGGLGQTALMVSTARLVLRESEPRAELIAGQYLAACGVGTVVVQDSNEAQRAIVASHGPDTKVVEHGEGREIALAPKPAWWPAAPGDDVALAYWRGAIAATAWMAETINRG
jgi:hypothetical protein